MNEQEFLEAFVKDYNGGIDEKDRQFIKEWLDFIHIKFPNFSIIIKGDLNED